MKGSEHMEPEVNQTGQRERPPEEDRQEAQSLGVEESCRRLSGYLESILDNAGEAGLDVECLAPPCRELGKALRGFQALAEELVSYSTQLSKGDLSREFPESGSCLYSGLKNLTWQAKQVTKGDYAQQVSHLGEFSEAFNVMTRQLKEREAQLKQEVQRAERRAEIIESYTEMLMELLSQRDEWMLVVDREKRVTRTATAASTACPSGPSSWSGMIRSATASGSWRKRIGAAVTALFPSPWSGRSGLPGFISSWMSPRRR